MTTRVFGVEGAIAEAATPVSLVEAGLKERRDMQAWVLAHPRILGDDVMVITDEFDRWQTASGARQLDRLDVLGLGADGRLVVAELKRDRAPDTVEMQAIKYAAMASRFTEEDLVNELARFLAAPGGDAPDREGAAERIADHAGELDPDVLRQPRIVLAATAFPPVVTASAVWLTEMGLDITLQEVQAYRVFSDRIVLTVSQVFPVRDVEEFTLSPQRAEAKAADVQRKRRRELSTVRRLVDAKIIEDGAILTLEPTNEVTPEVREKITSWIAEDPRRGRAEWHNDSRGPLTWEYDGSSYRPTPIVQQVLREVAGLERSPRGPRWWRLSDGRDLTEVAGRPSAGRDWSDLHAMLAGLPEGAWTTYGDLGAVIGVPPLPIGTHVASAPDCPNGHRVLGAGGVPSSGFRWADPSDTRSQEEALAEEGIAFDQGKADPARHWAPEELRTMLPSEEEEGAVG